MSSVKGIVKVILDLETFDSGFSKRGVVLTTEEKYPQDVKFDFVKDNALVLDKVAVGNEVEISYNIRGNEYNGKYYVNLEGWRIENFSGVSKDDRPKKQMSTDDLPF
jgi:hypothetical protein